MDSSPASRSHAGLRTLAAPSRRSHVGPSDPLAFAVRILPDTAAQPPTLFLFGDLLLKAGVLFGNRFGQSFLVRDEFVGDFRIGER
jgi:hypothetical protein